MSTKILALCITSFYYAGEMAKSDVPDSAEKTMEILREKGIRKTVRNAFEQRCQSLDTSDDPEKFAAFQTLYLKLHKPATLSPEALLEICHSKNKFEPEEVLELQKMLKALKAASNSTPNAFEPVMKAYEQLELSALLALVRDPSQLYVALRFIDLGSQALQESPDAKLVNTVPALMQAFEGVKSTYQKQRNIARERPDRACIDRIQAQLQKQINEMQGWVGQLSEPR